MTWFGRRGRAAVLLGRLVPGVRSLVWNAALIVVGYELGGVHLVEAYVGGPGTIAWILVAIVVVVAVARRDLPVSDEQPRSTRPQSRQPR